MPANADPNTGIAVVVTTKSPNVAFGITVAGTGNTRTVTLQADTAGYYLLRIWLADSSTSPGVVSQTVPDNDQTAEWYEVTDATGEIVKTIEYNGAHSWYVAAAMIGPVGVSGVLEFT